MDGSVKAPEGVRALKARQPGQIGIIISPVIFKDMPLPADEILKNLVELGINAVEIQDVRVESYAGAPASPRIQGRATPEQQDARRIPHNGPAPFYGAKWKAG